MQQESNSSMDLHHLFNFFGNLVELQYKGFYDKFDDIDFIWDTMCYLSPFTVLVSPPIKGTMLFLISRDWREGCDFC